MSTPENRENGKTDSFTAMNGGMISSVTPCSRRLTPTMARVATFASGIPIAFAMNGTVREARGFTSST